MRLGRLRGELKGGIRDKGGAVGPEQWFPMKCPCHCSLLSQPSLHVLAVVSP